MHVVDLGARDPVDVARRLAGAGGLAFLDSSMPHPDLGRWSFVAADPWAVLSVEDGTTRIDGRVTGEPVLDALRRLLGPAAERDDRWPPFAGGAVGYLGYEAARLLETLPVPPLRSGVADLRFGLYDVVVAIDHRDGTALLLSTGRPETGPAADARARRRADAILARLDRDPPPFGAAPPLAFTPDRDRADFERAVRRVIDYILSGDIFQANIARRLTAPLPADYDVLAAYLRLRLRNPAPFSAYLDAGDLKIASTSPERFLTLSGDVVETRPIKGTAPRSADPAEDARLAASLLASEKDRAENVMIVDLMRNDLSRVCRPHSVEVPVLAGLETYASVHHLVSVVRGRLEEGRDMVDLLAAAFPAGSITGAPKIRAMEIIAELEGVERGPYCGAVGYLGHDGGADLNVAIRTVAFTPGEAVLHAGGGITALSDPAAEYEETVVKAARILDALGSTA